MDSLHSIMDKRKKGTHLSLEERVIIQTRLKDHCSLRSIAREIGCSPSTIHYEIKRGAVKLYHGKVKRYKAQQGQSVYQNNRRYCGRKSDFLKKHKFIDYVQQHFFEDGWSLDACSNRCTAVGEFTSNDIVCTRTLYNYVDQGLLNIHNYDLPEKLKRNTKIHRIRKNKKKLGRSIEQRPQEVNKRDVFGHWECDLVLGHKTKDDEVLLTLSERMSREFLIIKIPDKTAAIDVLHAFYAKWNKSYNHVIRNLKDIESDLMVFYNYPKQIRASIYSTNMIESFNNVIKRKAKPKAEFPTEQSLDTFIGIQAMNRYFNRIHKGFGRVQDTLESYFD